MAKGADCKSAGLRLRRFESCLSHHLTLGDPAVSVPQLLPSDFNELQAGNGEDARSNSVDCCRIDTAPPKFLVLAFEPTSTCKGAGGVDMKAFVVASAALIASVGAAMSADLPVRAVSYTAAAPYNWSGCYIGAQAGYAVQRDGNDANHHSHQCTSRRSRRSITRTRMD